MELADNPSLTESAASDGSIGVTFGTDAAKSESLANESVSFKSEVTIFLKNGDHVKVIISNSIAVGNH